VTGRGKHNPLLRSYLFDCQALSLTVQGDKELKQLVRVAPELGIRIVTSALTTLEAFDPRAGAGRPWWDWTLSKITVVHTDDSIVRCARRLMADAQLHGRKYAIDAVLAAVAIAEASRGADQVTVFTSDVDDMEKLLRGSPVLVEPV
jgi:predicted nucleic acid-binding protein